MKVIVKKTIAGILKAEAKMVLAKYKPKVVTITGSVGKTSTKDAVYTVFAEVAHVRRSEKSFNSEIGLPLTVLGLPNGWNSFSRWMKNFLKGLSLAIFRKKYPKWLILEVGVGKPGDLDKTALWLKSDVVMFTAIGETPVHIEFFENREQLIEEKSKLIKTLKKDGVLILNSDDESVLALKQKTKSRVVTFGLKDGADVRGSEENIFYNDAGMPEGLTFRVDTGGSSIPVTIRGTLGKNHIYAGLGALALARGLELNMLKAAEALSNYEVPPGRMRLLSGINNSLIIDDTYNSSPLACEMGLKTLGEIKSLGGKKVAVLGDMLELGRHTIDEHRKVGALAKENSDTLIVVGPRAKTIKEGALDAGMNEKNIFEFQNSREAGEFLKTFVAKNDLLFIKGSQGVRMERTVDSILLDQQNKAKLLVRQDKEWLAKE